MTFDPAVFGQGFHSFVQAEYATFGVLAPILHGLTLVLLFLVVRFGNRVRRLFAVYFTINWAFLFGYWGIYATFYWLNRGPIYLAVYIAAPILLLIILVSWIREIVHPEFDLNIRVGRRMVLAAPILIWGYWYPAYTWGTGFDFTLRDLFFSYYGLMPCPTTMVVLSLAAVNYPGGNRRLFHLMTAYALVIGTATVITGWLPDIPFVIMGVYGFVLILIHRKGGNKA